MIASKLERLAWNAALALGLTALVAGIAVMALFALFFIVAIEAICFGWKTAECTDAAIRGLWSSFAR